MTILNYRTFLSIRIPEITILMESRRETSGATAMVPNDTAVGEPAQGRQLLNNHSGRLTSFIAIWTLQAHF